MRGVNKGDQLVGYYNIGQRSKKWWKKVFSYVIECALLNAYLLEKDLEPEVHDPSVKERRKRDFSDFHLDMAEQLIGYYTLCLKVAVLNLTLLTVQQLLDLTPVYDTTLNKTVQNEVCCV